MSTDSAPGNIGRPRPTAALPPVPLTEDQLEPLAQTDAIEEVYVPENGPATVYTLAGPHRGTIMEFYVETADRFVKYRYTMADDDRGLAWHRCLPTAKDDRDCRIVRRDLEDYRRLEVSG